MPLVSLVYEDAGDRRRAILAEARGPYERGLPPGLTWARALRWAHHNARSRRDRIETQMVEIRAAIEALEPSFGPYGHQGETKA